MDENLEEEKEIDQWQKDFAFVLNIRDEKGKPVYHSKDIAKRMKVSASHLSSCVSGSKKPGPRLRKKFYTHFKPLLPVPKKYPDYNHSPTADDPGGGYNEGDSNKQNESKKDNKYLEDLLNKTTDSLQTIADTNKEMAKSNKLLAESHVDLSARLMTIIEKINWKPS